MYIILQFHKVVIPLQIYFLIESGYTPNERLRFSEIIKEGCLVDSYRHFNPVPSSALKEDIPLHSYDDDNSGIG